jgi:hypothetical protein
MRQSNIIFATIVFAFVIYITLRGQLSDYIALFTGASTTTKAADNTQSTAAPNALENLGKSVQNLRNIYSNMGIK